MTCPAPLIRPPAKEVVITAEFAWRDVPGALVKRTGEGVELIIDSIGAVWQSAWLCDRQPGEGFALWLQERVLSSQAVDSWRYDLRVAEWCAQVGADNVVVIAGRSSAPGADRPLGKDALQLLELVLRDVDDAELDSAVTDPLIAGLRAHLAASSDGTWSVPVRMHSQLSRVADDLLRQTAERVTVHGNAGALMVPALTENASSAALSDLAVRAAIALLRDIARAASPANDPTRAQRDRLLRMLKEREADPGNVAHMRSTRLLREALRPSARVRR